MFARDWSAVIPEGEYERAQIMERGRPVEQALTHPAYADVHEFDRATIADFVHPADRDLPHRLADLYAARAQDLSASLATTRRDVISQWRSDALLPRKPQTDRLCSHAGRYLDARGYPMADLATLAVPLRSCLDGLVVRTGATLPTFANRGETFDNLDHVIACLHAGLSAREIDAHLRSGAWPAIDALAVLGALR